MEPARVGAHSGDERALWPVVQKAAVELAERAREISDAVTAYTKERLPDLFDNAEAVEANRASTEATIRDFAEVLRSGPDRATAVKLPSATLDYARDGAQHGVLLTTLMRSYRLGHAAASQEIRAILAKHAADADELTAASDLCSAWLFAYIDSAQCLAEEVYTTERERWIRSAAATQAETIDTILGGQPIDIDVAGRRLRHDLRRTHVAAIAWLDAHEEGRNTLAVLEGAIRDTSAAIGSQRPLIQPLGTLSIAAWISTSGPVPAKALDELKFIKTPSALGVRIAVGEPGRNIAGFRASHVEALEAQRIARLAGRREGSITHYSGIALQALATTNLDHARDFVASELGALAASDETTRRLAATVRTYLDEQGSRGRTAKRLGIHENTVSYRLRQAEELLARSVDKRTLELRVALALADLVDTNNSAGD